MINIHVGDFTGQLWVTLFDDHGKSLFGIAASEFKEMADKDPEEAHNLVKDIMSREYQFKIRNKEENYNGESKLRSNCLEINAVDYVSETKKMIDIIEKVNN